MKKIILFLGFTIPFVILAQENLIPNGNFETNSSNYNGGNDPTMHYSGVSCNLGLDRFESDISNWKVAKPSPIFLPPCSPDWIKPGIILGDGFCPANNSYYVRSASKQESIMVELKNGYKLKKGYTYKFRVKYRHARGMSSLNGVGSFQLVFSTNSNGL